MIQELAEINVVRANDGTFIIRTLSERGVNEMTTAIAFGGLVDRLREILYPQTPVASVQEATTTVN